MIKVIFSPFIFIFNIIKYFFLGIYYIFYPITTIGSKKKIVETEKPKENIVQDERMVAQIKEEENSATQVEKQHTNEELMINFDSDDANRSATKNVYMYKVKDQSGKTIKGVFEAYSKLDVRSFLFSEGYEIIEIKTSKMINFLYGGSTRGVKVKNKDLVFFLTQLSTYLKAGVSLAESIRILSKQTKNKKYQKLFQRVAYELTMGESFSNALEKQTNAFPKLLVNMIKTSELTGELPDTLKEMEKYYKTIESTKKQLISSLTYPAVIFSMAIAVLIFILVWIIPRFVEIYEGAEIKLPVMTVIVIAMSEFLKKYVLFLFIGIILLILILIALYKKSKSFRTACQWLFMHTIILNKILIYNEITMFTKTFGTLLKYGVSITECINILNKITNNEIYKKLMRDTTDNLGRGESLSSTFKDRWEFPEIAYYMMLTGERTGRPSEMLLTVADYYQEEQTNLVSQVKSLIEPIVIVFMAVVVGVILLSVIVPMFSLYKGLDV